MALSVDAAAMKASPIPFFPQGNWQISSPLQDDFNLDSRLHYLYINDHIIMFSFEKNVYTIVCYFQCDEEHKMTYCQHQLSHTLTQ